MCRECSRLGPPWQMWLIPFALLIAFISLPLLQAALAPTGGLTLEATTPKEVYARGEAIEISLSGIAEGPISLEGVKARYEVEYAPWGETGFLFYSTTRQVGDIRSKGGPAFSWHYRLGPDQTAIAPPGRYMFRFALLDSNGRVIASTSVRAYLTVGPTGLESIIRSDGGSKLLWNGLLPIASAAAISIAGVRLLSKYFSPKTAPWNGAARIGFVIFAPLLALPVIASKIQTLDWLVEGLAIGILSWTQFLYARYLRRKGVIEFRWDYYAIGFVQLIINTMLFGIPLGPPFVGMMPRRAPKSSFRRQLALPLAWAILGAALVGTGFLRASSLIVLTLFYYHLPWEGTNGWLLWYGIGKRIWLRSRGV